MHPLPNAAGQSKDVASSRRADEGSRTAAESAKGEQWLGEIDGIDLTLTFLRTKQADAARLTRRAPVALGIPTVPSRTDNDRGGTPAVTLPTEDVHGVSE